MGEGEVVEAAVDGAVEEGGGVAVRYRAVSVVFKEGGSRALFTGAGAFVSVAEAEARVEVARFSKKKKKQLPQEGGDAERVAGLLEKLKLLKKRAEGAESALAALRPRHSVFPAVAVGSRTWARAWAQAWSMAWA